MYVNLHSKRSVDNQSDDKIKLNDFLDAAAQFNLGIYFEKKKQKEEKNNNNNICPSNALLAGINVFFIQLNAFT